MRKVKVLILPMDPLFHLHHRPQGGEHKEQRSQRREHWRYRQEQEVVPKLKLRTKYRRRILPILASTSLQRSSRSQNHLLRSPGQFRSPFFLVLQFLLAPLQEAQGLLRLGLESCYICGHQNTLFYDINYYFLLLRSLMISACDAKVPSGLQFCLSYLFRAIY